MDVFNAGHRVLLCWGHWIWFRDACPLSSVRIIAILVYGYFGWQTFIMSGSNYEKAVRSTISNRFSRLCDQLEFWLENLSAFILLLYFRVKLGFDIMLMQICTFILYIFLSVFPGCIILVLSILLDNQWCRLENLSNRKTLLVKGLCTSFGKSTCF